MGKQITGAMLRGEVRKVTGMKAADEDFNLALVMLAGAFVGPSATKIAALTGLPIATTRGHVGTLRGRGIFTARHVRDSGWFGKDGGIAFNLDIGIAKGWLQRVPA